MKAVLENNVPAPNRSRITSHGEPISITETLKVCAVGNSFVVDQVSARSTCHAAAHKLGIKIVTEKIPLVGLRVYRIK